MGWLKFWGDVGGCNDGDDVVVTGNDVDCDGDQGVLLLTILETIAAAAVGWLRWWVNGFTTTDCNSWLDGPNIENGLGSFGLSGPG